jgi:hypothetical protein
MKRVHVVGMIAVLAAGAMSLPAIAGDVTVGRFYVELAQAKHLSSVDAAAAQASLRGAGFDVPALALDKRLTEGDMTSISNALGVSVTTEHPSQPITEVQLNTYMTSFAGQLGAKATGGDGQFQTFGAGTGGTDPGNSGNGKGKKKGHNKSSSEPQ